MAKKSSGNLIYVLIILLSGLIGYGVNTFMHDYALNNAKDEAKTAVDEAVQLVDKQVGQWKTAFENNKTKNNNEYQTILLPIENGNVANIDELSFGEQALIRQAIIDVNTAYDFVLASKDVPKNISQGGKYTFSLAKKTESQELKLVRTGVKSLNEQLNVLGKDYIGVQINPTNDTAHPLFKTANSFEHTGVVKSLSSIKNLDVNASYAINPHGLTPLMYGAISGILFFLMAIIPVLIKRLRNKKEHYSEPKTETDQTNSAINPLVASEIDTSALPLEPVESIVSDATQNVSSIATDSAIVGDKNNNSNKHNDGAEKINTQAEPNQNNAELDDLDSLATEIQSKEEDIAKYRSPNLQNQNNLSQNSQANNQAQTQTLDLNSSETTNNATLEFTSPFTDEELSISKETVDHKEQLADEELDDGNIIFFNEADKPVFTPSEKQVSSTIDQSGYRTFDVRTKANLITEEFIKRFAYGFSQICEAKLVVVGHDVRASSSSIANNLMGALTNLGVTVLDIGQVSTAVLAFAIKTYQGNGIMVTASHCSADDNGFKWFINDLSPTAEQVLALKNIAVGAEESQIQALSCDINTGSHSSISYDQKYLSAIDDDIMLVDTPKVVVDCLHGATAKYVKSAMESAGADVIILNDNTDGNFHTGNPNPYEKDRLNQLQQNILQNNANIGFAYDADGDRLAVMDGKGQLLSAETLLAVFAKFVLETHQSSNIIYDVKCSKAVTLNITSSGGVPVMFPTGSNLMRNTLRTNKERAIFAGEFSGHFIFNDDRFITYDDALYGSLRLLEYLSQADTSLTEVLESLYVYEGTEDIYYPLKDQNPDEILKQLAENWKQLSESKAELKSYTLEEMDGFRLNAVNAFGVVRASNTSKSLTIRFAGQNAESLKQIMKVFAHLTKSIDAELNTVIQSKII